MHRYLMVFTVWCYELRNNKPKPTWLNIGAGWGLFIRKKPHLIGWRGSDRPWLALVNIGESAPYLNGARPLHSFCWNRHISYSTIFLIFSFLIWNGPHFSRLKWNWIWVECRVPSGKRAVTGRWCRETRQIRCSHAALCLSKNLFIKHFFPLSFFSLFIFFLGRKKGKNKKKRKKKKKERKKN